MSAAICVLALLSTTSYVKADLMDDAIAEATRIAGGHENRSLSFSNKEVKSISDLHMEKMPEYVISLDLMSNSISSLDGLDCPNVEELRLSNNKLKNLKGKINASKVTKLIISNNKLSSLDGIENFPHVTDLNISNISALYVFDDSGKKEKNELKSLSGIEKLQELEKLQAGHLPLKSLEGIEKLSKLKVLRVTNSGKITEDMIIQLSTKLPDCDIDYIIDDGQEIKHFKNGEQVKGKHK